MAATLFARFGYNGVSLRDIAAKAGVNEVTIYRHYRCKRDLYCAALEAELKKVHLRGDLLSRLAESPDAHAAIERTFELIATVLKQDSNLIRLVHFSALELEDDVTPLLRRHLSELIEVVAGYLERWIATRDLPEADPRGLVVTMAVMVCSGQCFSRIFAEEFGKQQRIFSEYTWNFAAKAPGDGKRSL